MKIIKYLGGPLIVAILACICQIIDQTIGPMMPIGAGFGWVAFQAWASYFICGCNVEGGIKAFFAYIAGIVASILIMVIGGQFGIMGLGFMAMPIGVLIGVVPTICTEKVKLLSQTPIIFVAAGAFFGIMSYVPEATFATAAMVEMIYCVLGLILGYLTIVLRGAYDKKYNSAE